MTVNATPMPNPDVLRVELSVLREEHGDLDAAIAALEDRPGSDVLTIRRLKKRKLQLKEKIQSLEDRLTPDIIA